MPRMRWDPDTGESQVFGDNEPHPEGWLDHHPQDPDHERKQRRAEALETLADLDRPVVSNVRRSWAVPTAGAPAAPAVETPVNDGQLTKAEIMEALTEGNVTYNPRAKVDALRAQLVAALDQVLVTRGQGVPANATPAALLALVRGETQDDDAQ